MGNYAIGLTGYVSSGKTTVATYLEHKYGFQRLHIAETIRDMLRVMMRARGIDHEMINRYLTGDLKDGVVIPEFGVTSRHLQITLGTEWGRRYIDEDIWTDIWVQRSEGIYRPMNDSVRFPNEQRAIKDRGGIVIRVDRPGVGPAKFYHPLFKWLHGKTGSMIGVHPSERIDRIEADMVIVNDGSIEDLHAKIQEIFGPPLSATGS